MILESLAIEFAFKPFDWVINSYKIVNKIYPECYFGITFGPFNIHVSWSNKT